MSLPPVGIPLGAMRFNSDSHKLEYYNGESWFQIHTFSPDLNGGARGIWAAGSFHTGSGQTPTNIIDYVTISTAGNAVDFGDTVKKWKYNSGCASNTRGISGGGISAADAPAYANVMEYITIASTGDTTDFGDLLSDNKVYPASFSSQTRGIWGNGGPSGSKINTIGYATIASLGNCVDFGDTTQARSNSSGLSSPTRGIFAGGYTPTNVNTIDYITIATTGNARDFGDMTHVSQMSSGSGSATRGIFWSSVTAPRNTIDYITIATTGNAQEFGDSTLDLGYGNSCSSSIRSVRGGGQDGTVTNTIEYVTISSLGDAVDFGDLTTVEHRACGCYSNGHGGL